MNAFIRIAAIFIGMLVFSGSTFCQTPAHQPKPAVKSAPTYDVKASRQRFWDNLPRPTGWVNDYEGIFTPAQKTALFNLIQDFEKKTSIEIAIVTVDTLQASKENFDALALHIHNKWGVGKRGVNNGIVILISAGLRKIRMSNGDGIVKKLSDKDAKQIIDHYFTPGFKKGDYYNGTRVGLDQIITRLDASGK